MRAVLALALLAALSGCHQYRPTSPDQSSSSGRYHGIGIATPGDRWKKLADAPQPHDDKTATLRDDDYVVFVTDGQTGEVRECGDRSGFCIAVQPWQHPAPNAPLKLTQNTKIDDGDTVSNLTDDSATTNTN